MKKLLLTSTSILAVAFASQAFAGGSSTNLQQTGWNQKATIDQTGPDGWFRPIGATNGKVGTPADPFVQQNGDGIGGNVISITQTGTGNSAGHFWHKVGQSGTTNNATITQSGDNGTVTLSQNGTNNGQGNIGPFNFGPWKYYLDGGTANQGAGNNQRIGINQNQSNNRFNIQQRGNNPSVAWINDVWLEQDARNNTLIANQNGSGLNVSVRQDAPGHGAGYNDVVSFQTGDHNSLISYQENSAGASNSKNTITNTQSGSHDTVYVNAQKGTQLTITSTQTGVTDMLSVTSQTGTLNDITNTQSGTNNTATVTSQSGNNEQIRNKQSGTGGTATYSQTGAYNIATLQDQKGSGNQFSATQSGVGFNGYTNVILAGQNGYNNTIDMTQSGSYSYSNSAYLAQGFTIGGTSIYVAAARDDNHITGTQSGHYNTAYVSQISSGNTGNFSQTGIGNTTTIKQ